MVMVIYRITLIALFKVNSFRYKNKHNNCIKCQTFYLKIQIKKADFKLANHQTPFDREILGLKKQVRTKLCRVSQNQYEKSIPNAFFPLCSILKPLEEIHVSFYKIRLIKRTSCFIQHLSQCIVASV